MGDIRLGTSGYSFQDWKGTVYPASIKNSEMFDYYLNQFRLNTVELNYTYYRMPTSKVFESYAKRTPDGFDFTVKLFSGITHEPFMNGAPPALDTGLCAGFLDGVGPLVDSGKLGCLLAQFPPHLRPLAPAWEYLFYLKDAFDGYDLVFEFRNREWAAPDTVQMLEQMGVGYCAVDEPQIGPLMPLVPAVTSHIGYLRLHGRNKHWFKNKTVRYDYLYSDEELAEFLPIIHSMASQSSTLYVEFNNCHAGSALRNVKTLQNMLELDEPPLQGVLF